MRTQRHLFFPYIITVYSILVTTAAYADTLIATGTSIVSVDPVTNESSTFIASAGGGMFFEETSEKLYFVGPSNTIQRANRDGSGIVTIISDVGSTIGDVVIDTANSRVIWTQPDDALIRRADLNGANIANLVVGASFVRGLAINQTAGKLYWSGFSEIGSADLDGMNYTPVYLEPSDPVVFWNLVLVGTTLFFTDNTGGRVLSVGTNGSGFTVLRASQTYASGIGYSSTESKIYYAGATNGANLISMDSDGANPAEVAVLHGYDIIANYFVDDNEAPEPVGTPVPTPTPEPTAVPTPTPPFTRMYMSLSSTTPGASKIIWTSIYRDQTLTQASVTNPRALGYSKKENRIYWTDRLDSNTTVLRSADPNGGTVKDQFAGGYHYESMYVDDTNNKIFLAQGIADLGMYDRLVGQVWRLQNIPNAVISRGFAPYGGDIGWTSNRNIYYIPRNYNQKKSTPYFTRRAFYESVTAATSSQYGPLFLLGDTIDFLYNPEVTSTTPYETLDFRARPYRYSRIAVQHLDPSKYDVPYVLYLASTNKVDMLIFIPEPRIIPFLRFSEDITVTDMLEVPLNGATPPLSNRGPYAIYGKVDFVDFSTTRVTTQESSKANVQVHLTLVSRDESSRVRSQSTLPQTSYSTTTDENGEYEFDGLEENATYSITFQREDLDLSSYTVTAIAGEEAPPVIASLKDLSNTGCSTKSPSKKVLGADRKNQALARYALAQSSRALSKAKGSMRTRLEDAAEKVNGYYAELLELSQSLPIVQLSCNEETTCTEQEDKTPAQRYKTKAKSLAKASKALLKLASKSDARLADSLAKGETLARAATESAKGLPTRTYTCETGPVESEEPGA